MGALIDTSVFIDVEKGRVSLPPEFGSADDEFFVSVVTVSELLTGAHRAKPEHRKSQRMAFVEGVIASFPTLHIDLNIARAHSLLWTQLATAGNLIGPHDQWLAATCLANGFDMITGNVREFTRVPGLNVRVWPS